MWVQTNKTEFLHSPRSQIYLFLNFFSRKMLQVPCLLSFVWFSCKLANMILTITIETLDHFLKALFPYLSLFYICFLYDQPRQRVKNQRHYFANKDPSNQSYGFSCSHMWMWELDCKESWAPKNWCFWTVVLEKTLESPLDSKEIQPIHPKGNQSWIFTGRTDAEAETPILLPPDVKNWLIWKDPDAGIDWRQEKGATEDEMVGWRHQLHGHEFD